MKRYKLPDGKYPGDFILLCWGDGKSNRVLYAWTGSEWVGPDHVFHISLVSQTSK